MKTLAAKAATAASHKIASKAAAGETSTVDAELQKLVDQTPEGTIFRKDLPFPTRLEVRTTRRDEMDLPDLRSHPPSKSGPKWSKVARPPSPSWSARAAKSATRSNNRVSPFLRPISRTGPKKLLTRRPHRWLPPVQPVIFRKSDKTWEADDSHGFRAAMLSQQLSPVFEQLLVENALATRPLWFAKRRFKIGDQLDVAGDALPMLLTGNATDRSR